MFPLFAGGNLIYFLLPSSKNIEVLTSSLSNMGGAPITSLKEFQSKNDNALIKKGQTIKSLNEKLEIQNSQSYSSEINKLNISEDSLSLRTLNSNNEVSQVQERVTKIIKEVNKENGFSIIQDESSGELSNSQSQLVDFTRNFKELYQKVKEWKNKGDLQKIRIKQFEGRDGLPEKTEPLTQSQRKALLTYYEIFSGLKGSEIGFLKEINNVNNNSSYQKVNNTIPENNKKLIQALKDINWEGLDRVSFGKYLRINDSGKDYDPFSILLEAEYLKNARNEAIKWDDKVKNFQRGRSEDRCSWTSKCQRWSEESTRSLSGVKEDIENQVTIAIAYRLLKIMIDKFDLENL
ncbi:OmpH family outer membrane protein [Mycoplasma parvum]|uniref:OmpH family outer membrane protein n=1 Tax=Mycoplasma parvum TaxID=984991 RepID=UPI001182FE10|nr:OmpH family outer membrane protein [Mycoplasma parvum]